MTSQSVLIDIAAAIVSELNDGEFSKEFTATRIYDPERKMEELETLRVDVIAGDITTTAATRSTLRGEYRVEIAVRQKLDVSVIANLDALALFVEEIDNFFSSPPRRLTDYPPAAWKASQVVYPYLPVHLRKLRQFTSLIRLTYTVFTKP